MHKISLHLLTSVVSGFFQFIQRIGIMLMPVKYQPDLIYLRHVKTMRVHLFTAVQLACFIGMWVVKQIKLTSIAFPVMVIMLSKCTGLSRGGYSAMVPSIGVWGWGIVMSDPIGFRLCSKCCNTDDTIDLE